MTEQVARYLHLFELQPGASIEEVNTAYFTCIEQLAKNPTEEDEARLNELRRAYDILRRAYVPRERQGARALPVRGLGARTIGIAAAILLAVLIWLDRGAIRLRMTRYEPGTVLRLASATAPFGTVVGYEPTHRFPTGEPGAAYALRVDGKREPVWVAERTVVNGMTPVAK